MVNNLIQPNSPHPHKSAPGALELGIVLTLPHGRSDFQTGLRFLQDYLRQFDIGPNDVRVSIIPYGRGVYTRNAFNLTKYSNKEDVINAVGRIYYSNGDYTDTGKGIQYMHTAQLIPGVVRPGVTRIGLVITDGDSQEPIKTAQQAKAARDKGITMFALGVGDRIKDQELYNIAGDESRVARVENYKQLNKIINKLAKMTCVKQEKTTTPPPSTACGVLNPADVYFVFSQADLGLRDTVWATGFIAQTISSKEMEEGFQYGVISGSCPDDTGFALNEYRSVTDIRERLKSYQTSKLTPLAKKLLKDGFTSAKGGRTDAQKVAVFVVSGNKSLSTIGQQISELTAQAVKVFIADPTYSNVKFSGATTLQGDYSAMHPTPSLIHTDIENIYTQAQRENLYLYTGTTGKPLSIHRHNGKTFIYTQAQRENLYLYTGTTGKPLSIHRHNGKTFIYTQAQRGNLYLYTGTTGKPLSIHRHNGKTFIYTQAQRENLYLYTGTTGKPLSIHRHNGKTFIYTQAQRENLYLYTGTTAALISCYCTYNCMHDVCHCSHVNHVFIDNYS
ncbi:hypothetical protein Btru_021658 [Bulinus truncatus]|nr:hypothetical protein Btru_021658 [Bulinus truncatus]